MNDGSIFCRKGIFLEWFQTALLLLYDAAIHLVEPHQHPNVDNFVYSNLQFKLSHTADSIRQKSEFHFTTRRKCHYFNIIIISFGYNMAVSVTACCEKYCVRLWWSIFHDVFLLTLSSILILFSWHTFNWLSNELPRHFDYTLPFYERIW